MCVFLILQEGIQHLLRVILAHPLVGLLLLLGLVLLLIILLRLLLLLLIILLILVLLLVVILLVLTLILVLLIAQELLCQRQVITRLVIRGIQTQRLLVGFHRLAIVFAIHEDVAHIMIDT